MHPSTPAYSVVIPAYNEEPNLAPLLEELCPVMNALGRPWEVVVVDDGSSDGSAERLAELAQHLDLLRVVTLVRNSGQTAAFMAGFRAARGETVITLDADLQIDPADIPRLLEHMPNHQVVCGIRRRRRDSWLRRASSRFANRFRRLVLGDSITDIGCPLKILPRRDLLGLPPFEGMHRFLPALLQHQGLSVAQVEVDHRPRHAGESKYNVRNRALRALADLLAVRWMMERRLRYEIKK
jgi:glycosyltransferase involved in cell wall biosynthesis